MKWTLKELKRTNDIVNFKYTLDLNEQIKGTDIEKIDPVVVKGQFEYINGLYEFDYKIVTSIYMECAYTLELVEIPISKWFTDTFSEKAFDGNIYLERDFILLEDMAFANILVEKPYRVISKNAKEFHDDEKPKEENPVFSGLKKYLEGDE